MAEPIWSPTPEVVERANVVRLMRRHGIDEYAELLRRSQEEPDWFWPAVVEVPTFSGFAAPAVAQRLQDGEAKVVIRQERSLRRGREVPMLATVEEARREAPSVEHVVLAPWDDLVAGSPGTLEPLALDSE